MPIKIKYCLPLVVQIVVLFSLLQGHPVHAESPWKWEFAMKRDILQDSMVLPTAVFIDKEKEQYYVVDSGRNRLISFNRQGEMLHIFNAGKSLETPFDMTRTPDGIIWVVEKAKNSLARIDLAAKDVKSLSLEYQGRKIYPHRLDTNNGYLYVLDKATGDIFSFDTQLQPRLRYSCDTCVRGFVDFKFYDKKLWALNQDQKTVFVFKSDGSLSKKIELEGSINLPVSLAVGPTGFIYILDREKRSISVFDDSGIFKYSFLRHGFARGELYYPIEISFDPWGRLCVVDEGNARVEVFVR